MLISYNWLKSYIPEIPKEDEIANLITFHLCEIESVEKLKNGDTVFDLKILPDRAHDLLSHQGVAREIASLLGLKISSNFLHNSFPEVLGSPRQIPLEARPDHLEKNSASKFEEIKTNLQIEIQTENCRRYMGRIIKGIKVGPSPDWIVKYLESVGQRSINNIVDATNIVMLDCGQPIHAFDLSKIPGKKIVVKNANDGDVLELVGSEKLKANLKNTDIVISDGEKNLAVAGVKGGLDSGISDTTTDILIEVASFDAVSVRKTARRLGILTDASKRYENDLSPTLCDFAMNEISALALEMCPDASFEEVVDVYNKIPEERTVNFETPYISKMLGVKISTEEIEEILKNYNYKFTRNGGTFELIVPLMRLDITGGHDMVEEIGRAYGYSKIIPSLPSVSFERKDNDVWVDICIAKQKLINDGYKEVMNYVFQNKGEVEVLASASDKKFLRSNLSDGLKESVKLNISNLPLLDMDEIKIFEIGAVFTKKGEQINVAYGDKKEVKEMSLDNFLKNVSPEFHSENTNISLLSNSSLRLSQPAQVSQNKNLASHSKENSVLQIFKPWSVYPFITRDIAVWIPETVSPELLIDVYKDFGTELLVKEPKLFDSFTKNEKTSFAYRLVFQSDDRTLTNEEIDVIMKNITEKITSLGWEVR